VNPHQSLAGLGPARQGSARSAGISEGVSGPNPSIRTRPAGDLFQPVTSSTPHPAALTVEPVAPVDGPEQGGELMSAPAPGYVSGARWWVGRGDGLMFGMPGVVIALVASVVLVLVLTGVTVFTTSLSTESPVVGLTPDQLPALVTPLISDGHPATVAPLDASARPTGQTPAEASSPDPSPVAAHPQPVPATHRVSAAPAQTPPASDPGPVVSPPSSTVTTDDARSRTVTTGSHTAHTESRTTTTQPCDCEDTTRKVVPPQGDRPPKVDHHRGPRAPQAGNPQRARPQNPGSASKEKRGAPRGALSYP